MSWSLLAVLIVAGAALRAWPVATRSLWHDEVMTWKAVQTGLPAILTWTHHYEHPPLSYLLVWLSEAIFRGDSEWIVRLPSLIAGVLCIPAAYLLGGAIASRSLGLLVALQVAFDLNAIAQSQQARMYTLTVLMVLLTLAATMRALREPTLWRWVFVGIGLAAAFAASHMGLMLWAAIPLGVLLTAALERRREPGGPFPGAPQSERSSEPPPATPRTALPGLALAYAVAILLCSVGFVHMASRLSWFRDKSGTTPFGDRLLGIASDWGHAYGGLPLALAALLVGLLGLSLLYRRHRAAVLVLLSLIAVNLLFALPVQPHGFEPRPRYVILMQIPVWIGIAHAVLALRCIALRIPAVAGLLAVLAWLSVQSLSLGNHWQYRYGDAIRLIRDRVQPGDAIVYYPAWVEAVPWYYGLPPTHNPPPWGGGSERTQLPFDALPTDRPTWLVIAYHHETGATDAAPDMIAAVAEKHGLTIDREAYRSTLESQPVVVARIDRSGVVLVDLSSELKLHDADAATPPG